MSLQNYFSKRASRIVPSSQRSAASTTEELPVVDNTLPTAPTDASEDLGPPYVAGGPPFPAHPTDDVKLGLSILDWFAGHALSGLCANPKVMDTRAIDAVIVQELVANAYTIAGWMVDLRSNIPVEPTPPPEEHPADAPIFTPVVVPP